MREIIYKAFFGFCGSGGKALGIQRARKRLLDTELGYRVIGGFDVSPIAVRNFRYITGVEALCADVREITPAMLRAAAGGVEPDLVCASPPCKGASKLITDEKAADPHYEALNELALVWTRLMLETWRPRIVIYENVPNITTRAPHVIQGVRDLLAEAGYLFNDAPHELGAMGPTGEFYDAGEAGGLAQRRKRWLLIARAPKACSALVYKPIKQRLKGIGEVIGGLPMPNDPAGGPLHVLPKTSLLNLIRLAMIPAGGDWRDLPGVLAEEQERRAVFRRMHLARWEDPSVTVGGSGSNGPYAVADPRVLPQSGNEAMHTGKYAVRGWDQPAKTVIGAGRVGSGAQSVADPRVKCAPWAGAYGVTGWESPSPTVTGSSAVDNRPVSVADPRGLLPKKRYFPGCLGVVPWDAAMGTVCGESNPQNGAFSVADPRVKHAFDRGYSVVPWDAPANTIAGGTAPGQGAYSVADPRTDEAPAGWLTLDDVMVFLETPGPWAIVDRSSDGPPLAIIHDLAKAPSILVRIVARDGTWHRPLTPLELAVIQGLPAVHNGAPLVLAGTMTEIRESIGDMVPPGAAQAWGEVSLLALGQHDLSAFSLSGGGGDVWVDPQEELAEAMH